MKLEGIKDRPHPRPLTIDRGLALLLCLVTIVVYARLFIRVPALSEVRDFMLQTFGSPGLWRVLLPTGNVYRPFSWWVFSVEQRLFPFNAQALNLFQFSILGLCVSAGYIHLRQLRIGRGTGFAACLWWIFSLPTFDAAFWQATQHSKLAVLFILVALIVALHAIRTGKKSGLLTGAILALVVLANGSMPVAFVLPGALVALVVIFSSRTTIRGWLEAGRVLRLPAIYGTLYAVVFMLMLDTRLTQNAIQGDVATNFSRYAGFLTVMNDSFLVTLIFFTPVVAAWSLSLYRGIRSWRRAHRSGRPMSDFSNSREAVLLYLFALFAGSLILVLRSRQGEPYYVLMPMFPFGASLCAVVGSVLASPRRWIRRAGLVYAVPLTLFMFAYLVRVIPSSENYYGQRSIRARNVSSGYEVLRNAVDVEKVDGITFAFPQSAQPAAGSVPVEPQDYVFFMTDSDRDETIGPTIPSFIFRQNVTIPIRASFADDAPLTAETGLLAVWSNDFELLQVILNGARIYDPTRPHPFGSLYTVGETLAFGPDGNGADYLGSGWTQPDAAGALMEGSTASLALRFAPDYPVPLEIELSARNAGALTEDALRVEVIANGRPLAAWPMEPGGESTVRFGIPAEVSGTGYLDLRLRIASQGPRAVREPRFELLSVQIRMPA